MELQVTLYTTNSLLVQEHFSFTITLAHNDTDHSADTSGNSDPICTPHSTISTPGTQLPRRQSKNWVCYAIPSDTRSGVLLPHDL